MIANRATSAPTMLWQNRWLVVTALTMTAVVEVANDFIDLQRPVFSFAAVGLLVTALSISLVFRVNEAYARWWEARTLWGSIVNDSRCWARQVCSFVTGGDAALLAQTHRRLVYRQIAYVHALRLLLREQVDTETLEPFLPSGEQDELARRPNRPAALLHRQGEELSRLRERGAIDAVAHHRLDTTLTALAYSQGGCERIKYTVFPDRIAHFTRWSARLMAVTVPILVLRPENDFDVVDFIFVPIMMLAFLLTERLGTELKRPFENLPNDTPMTAICRTIEIDLRAAVGETELPPPLEPVDGVLM